MLRSVFISGYTHLTNLNNTAVVTDIAPQAYWKSVSS